MNAIDLPLVQPALSLPEALAVMRAHKVSGVLVAVPGTPRLARAEDVTDAMNRAVDAGGDPQSVPLVDALPTPPPVPPAHLLKPFAVAALPLGLSSATEALHGWFVETDADHAATSILAAGRARLVTSSETMTLAVGSAVTLCYCKGNPKHTLTRSQIRPGCLCSRSHSGPPVKVKCDNGPCR